MILRPRLFHFLAGDISASGKSALENGQSVKGVPPKPAARLRVLLLVPAVLLAGMLVYLYARLVEVDWIRVKHIDVPIRGLPEQFEGFEIVHLSDLHVTEMGEREKKLPAMVNAAGADAIFITGDFTEYDENLPIVASVISQMNARYGMWGVLGNWDSSRTPKACEEAGLKMLLGETDTIEIGGEKLGVIGLRFDDALRALTMETHRERISSLRKQLPEGIPIILLEHEPRIVRAAREEDIDLVLSGHTHGGQVRIPFGPAIVTPSDMGIWYSKGLHKFKNTYLHINPGIGLEPGPDYLHIRFWCRPEITVISLRAQR